MFSGGEHLFRRLCAVCRSSLETSIYSGLLPIFTFFFFKFLFILGERESMSRGGAVREEERENPKQGAPRGART